MSEKVERPDVVEEEHLIFLDDLRERGATNMFGAGSYLQEQFPELGSNVARGILTYWMESFSERHPD